MLSLITKSYCIFVVLQHLAMAISYTLYLRQWEPFASMDPRTLQKVIAIHHGFFFTSLVLLTIALTIAVVVWSFCAVSYQPGRVTVIWGSEHQDMKTEDLSHEKTHNKGQYLHSGAIHLRTC